jgi:hypothetical protein
MAIGLGSWQLAVHVKNVGVGSSGYGASAILGLQGGEGGDHHRTVHRWLARTGIVYRVGVFVVAVS